MERALADLEIVEAAYAEEIQVDVNHDNTTGKFPLRFTLKLRDEESEQEDAAALVTLEFVAGYPTETGVQVVSYRSRSPRNKARIDETVSSIRKTAIVCLEEGVEGGLACCSAAFEAWSDYRDNHPKSSALLNDNSADDERKDDGQSENIATAADQPASNYKWFTGEPLLDKKSAFQAHVCQLFSEKQVKGALMQLIGGSSKIQKATHNMWAYRIKEVIDEGKTALKHDNDDDGEDAAGARLAHLLEMRKEDCVLVVVSRWYGGIKLGPKRFAHINNVARELLQECHDKHLLDYPE